jgi:hypothetical protein
MIWIILAFWANFTSCWIRIRIRNADPDPGDKFNADPCGSGSETLLTYIYINGARELQAAQKIGPRSTRTSSSWWALGRSWLCSGTFFSSKLMIYSAFVMHCLVLLNPLINMIYLFILICYKNLLKLFSIVVELILIMIFFSFYINTAHTFYFSCELYTVTYRYLLLSLSARSDNKK